MALSALAVDRWADRVLDIEPENQIGKLLDEHYPNEKMEEIYPNMDFLHQSDIIE